MWTSHFKKRPHMMQMFVHNRAETPFPKHPSLDTQPSNTGATRRTVTAVSSEELFSSAIGIIAGAI
ncbi:hypothetical protein E2C01_049534 [Portunus trituberculatus]|uniref:Uncharacterized protein n=1 Tax=Portunus trituberculatus TaxID=210409 RepID=A0A5B7G6N1_PORTR|nr:hypothetical protein [Portunus trituberculatus]